jgi:hypothetical protein
MSEIYTLLDKLRDNLRKIKGVNTCEIGMEASITPDSYPLIRLVPSRVSKSNNTRLLELLLYYGEPIHEFETGGLEEIYRRHFETEALMLTAVNGTGWVVKYRETFYDEDRLPAYKLLAMRFEVDLRGC